MSQRQRHLYKSSNDPNQVQILSVIFSVPSSTACCNSAVAHCQVNFNTPPLSLPVRPSDGTHVLHHGHCHSVFCRGLETSSSHPFLLTSEYRRIFPRDSETSSGLPFFCFIFLGDNWRFGPSSECHLFFLFLYAPYYCLIFPLLLAIASYL